jgi:dipeptidyl aminopeptidase/acylaminoacyl peptidase
MRQRDLFVKDSGGAGEDELLIASDLEKNVEDWSPDGKFLLFNHVVPGPRELWVLPMTGERKPVVAVKGITGNGVQQAAFSPDGRYIAYTSSESGRPEVYVQTFPAGGGKWQVSNNTGTEPRWRADGKELYYTTGGTITAVEVKAGGSRFEAGSPRTLFAAQLNIGGRNRYIVTPDGKRFLAIVRGEEAPAPPMNVVVNWFSAAKR